MPRLMTAALACLALVLGGAVLAGCGSDSSSSDSGSAASTPAAAPPSTAPAKGAGGASGSAAGVVNVSMKNVKFVPEKITAKVGQTIKWTNNDGFAHTVTAKSGESFDSGNVDGGGTFEYKVDKPGTINYVCTIHPGQKGTITVTK